MAEIGVYILHNPHTDHMYVGSGDLTVRKQKHFRTLLTNKHDNRRLQAAYNQNPEFEFVSVPTKSREEAYVIEQAIVDAHHGNPLFLNLSRDVRAGVYEMTEETRQKLRDRPITEEHRKKLSEAGKGRVLTEETKEKLRQINLGKEIPEKTRQKIREARARQVFTDEARAKLSASLTGREFSEQHKAKLGEKAVKQWSDPTFVNKVVAAVSHPVEIQGVVYPSVRKAAEALGIPAQTVSSRLKSQTDQFKDWNRAS